MSNTSQDIQAPQQVTDFKSNFQNIRQELNRVFVGHDDLVTDLLAAVTTGGHVLLEGVPGLGKTLLARSLASSLDLDFKRIQFTPDLMPADVTGSLQLREDETGTPKLVFQPGPLMANFVLADEINRATAKTQSALLEAMQEYQITVGDKTLPLPQPFTVIATQNPIEQDGTYALPEAELDRFLVKLELGYPKEEEYAQIIDLTTGQEQQAVKAVCSGQDLIAMKNTIRQVIAGDQAKHVAIRIVMATQPESGVCPADCQKYLQRGAGPRAVQGIILMAKAYALIKGNTAIGEDDVKRAALPVLRHRIALSMEARLDSLTPDQVLTKLIQSARL